jgi:hypothetical protein
MFQFEFVSVVLLTIFAVWYVVNYVLPHFLR